MVVVKESDRNNCLIPNRKIVIFFKGKQLKRAKNLKCIILNSLSQNFWSQLCSLVFFHFSFTKHGYFTTFCVSPHSAAFLKTIQRRHFSIPYYFKCVAPYVALQKRTNRLASVVSQLASLKTQSESSASKRIVYSRAEILAIATVSPFVRLPPASFMEIICELGEIVPIVPQRYDAETQFNRESN